MTRKFPCKTVANLILNGKPKLTTLIRNNATKDWSKSYSNSQDNVLRSLNVFYSHNVMGTAKYISVRKANRNASHENTLLPNYISYKHLSTMINSIDIGTLNDLSDLDSNEKKNRDAIDYVMSLYHNLQSSI